MHEKRLQLRDESLRMHIMNRGHLQLQLRIVRLVP